jgi:phosphoglycerate dehydrogenase-like enzyme
MALHSERAVTNGAGLNSSVETVDVRTINRILVEDDDYLRIVSTILDPEAPEERRSAIADFVRHDVPDFADWCRDVWRMIPDLYPATVEFAFNQEDLRAKLPLADGVIVESLRIGETELALAPRLAAVMKFGTLLSNIDVAACKKRGVPIETHARRVNIAVAEHAFTLMIALAKRLCETAKLVDETALRKAGFDPTPYDRRYTTNSNFGRIRGLRTLNGSTFGAVGMGEVGRNAARRAAAFGMKVIYYQRHPMNAQDERDHGAKFVSLEELLERSDFLSLHLPLNDATKGIIDRRALARVKHGAILVNVARAQLVDREALLEALDSGRLGGYGLDVGYEEPASPDEPLLEYKNVILTPHLAVAGRENGLLDMADIFAKLNRAIAAKRNSLAERTD